MTNKARLTHLKIKGWIFYDIKIRDGCCHIRIGFEAVNKKLNISLKDSDIENLIKKIEEYEHSLEHRSGTSPLST